MIHEANMSKFAYDDISLFASAILLSYKILFILLLPF